MNLAACSNRVFSPSVVNLVQNGESVGEVDQLLLRASKTEELALRSGVPSRGEVLEALLRWQFHHYRNEYLYKNLIAEKLFLGTHSLNTATLLTEFRVGGSVADAVLINGEATAFEVKTELDSPTRLLKQIEDYQKAFPSVVVVTHHSMFGDYEKVLEGSGVGITVLTARRTLSKVVSPQWTESKLDVTTMMKSLRKNEYSNIVRDVYGCVPEVPNTMFFRECLRKSLKIDPDEYQKRFYQQLRLRQLAAGVDRKELNPIRSLVFKANPSIEKQDRLISWVERSIEECTFHTSEVSDTNS